jgi:hypothetical protein
MGVMSRITPLILFTKWENGQLCNLGDKINHYNTPINNSMSEGTQV